MKELAIICNLMKNAGMNVKELVDEYNLARHLAKMEERYSYLFRNAQGFEGKKFALEYSVQDLEGKKPTLKVDKI
ncbi:MAG TPA: hypothetical protein VF884_03870 [Nitrososphaeraceae archaeon]